MTVRYCPYFCEENVWHLCADDAVAEGGAPIPIGERRVVVLSNPRGRVAMRRQRAGSGRGGAVLWDYHVVLAARGRVWDLDSTLGCPAPLDRWAAESFLPRVPGFEPRFRVVDAPTYRARFASDRSHMRGPDGVPLQPFPEWPAIGKGMTLPRFIDLNDPFVGEIVGLDDLARVT